MKRVAVLIVSVLALLPPRPASAQQHNHDQNREQYRIEPRRVERAPTIDGVLDEAVWKSAAMVDTFTQQEPAEGDPATERTEVLLLYDGARLHIGVRAYDSNPEGIIATEMRRDSPRLLDEDNFQVILDTFHDSRSGYMFVTNPLGAKLEQQVFEEGEGNTRGAAANVNRSWDGVWNAAARRTSDGWTAEIAIPLVTLRFPDVDSQTWGINFMRNIRRKNEQVFWAPIPKMYGLTRVSLAGALTGMTGLSQGLDLRIKPFLVVGGNRDRTGSLVASRTQKDIGLDVKYGVRSGLTLDLTLNTDFAQAEVDEQQINLTRFPLFFPEKREFFLENSGQATVSPQSSDRLMDLFFSRQIGLSDGGQPIPIVGGARLTGKVGRSNVALMNIQTDEALGRPGDNFLVARYSRDIFSRSKIGGLLINKEARGASHFNRTFAVDTVLTPHRSFTIQSILAKTSTTAVREDQQAFHTRAAWQDPKWNLYAEYSDIDDNFNAEVGFVPRVGIRTTKLHVERTPRPEKGPIRVMRPMMTITYTTDQHNRLLTRRVHHMVGTSLQDGSSITVIYNRWLETLDVPFAIRSNVRIPMGTYRFGEWQLSYDSNPSRRFYQRIQYSPQTFYDGTRTDLDLMLGLRATSQFAAEFTLQRNDVDLPWGAFVVNLGLLRIDYALSPRMTLRSLSQYNSSTRQLSTSARFNFIYRPGSDLYIVYDEMGGNLPGRPEVRNRQLLIKTTYLLVR